MSLQQLSEAVVSRRLFQTRGPATAKLLSQTGSWSAVRHMSVHQPISDVGRLLSDRHVLWPTVRKVIIMNGTLARVGRPVTFWYSSEEAMRRKRMGYLTPRPNHRCTKPGPV